MRSYAYEGVLIGGTMQDRLRLLETFATEDNSKIGYVWLLNVYHTILRLQIASPYLTLLKVY